MKKITLLISLLIGIQYCYGQYIENAIEEEETTSKTNIGLGIGLDYGGIGGRLQFLPIKNLGIYAGVGYAIVGLGYNFGAQLKMLPGKVVCPTFGVMYGYNGVIKVQGLSQFDKIYYGPSISGGIEIHFKRKANFLNFELVVPFRSQAFYNDWDTVKNTPGIVISAEPLPVAFSIGYHFALDKTF